MSSATTFLIALNLEGEGNDFHIKNAPDEVTRKHIHESGRSLWVQADLVAVVHGQLDAGGEPATLIVTDFWFLPAMTSRRFTWASISFTFAASGSKLDSRGPQVVSIAPMGHFSLNPTKKEAEEKHSLQVPIKAGLKPFVDASPTIDWNLTERYNKTDQTTLSGAMRMEGREFGGKDTAKWVLMENGSTKAGIPSLIRTAILLKHRPSEASRGFQATVTIEAQADLMTSVENLIDRIWGRIPVDDPLIFDPKVTLSDADVQVQAASLASEDLTRLCRVCTMTPLTVWAGDQKAKGGGGKATSAEGKASAEAHGA